ncbi:MAG: tetraacyldisaccharide 4'-kinase [Proteobacteria bacterium]|nr:tetraacyldisaccharide 4'-kinase [Pseudomonadota bacterium]
MKSLALYWYRSDFLASLLAGFLLPLSWLYCAVAVSRRKVYQLGLKKSYGAAVPVVVIGNIVVGGSGKTPLLISICEFIKNNGFKPGVVSRGYGGKVKGLKQVHDSDSAELVGDEPLMICQRTGVPVVVGADRVAAVNYLLEHNQCDVVLSDDGLQHYRMQRNVEIAVIDSSRGFGNGFCLPAGPLRERVSRLDEVDIVVYNDAADESSVDMAEDCSYVLKVADVCHLNSEEATRLSSFTGKKVHAVAGIGDPSRFFSQLCDDGIDIVEHAYPDHHAYAQADFSGWEKECIIMTEKDAVKCRQLSLPDAWVVSVQADMSDLLISKLSTKILPLLKKTFN